MRRLRQCHPHWYTTARKRRRWFRGGKNTGGCTRSTGAPTGANNTCNLLIYGSNTTPCLLQRSYRGFVVSYSITVRIPLCDARSSTGAYLAIIDKPAFTVSPGLTSNSRESSDGTTIST